MWMYFKHHSQLILISCRVFFYLSTCRKYVFTISILQPQKNVTFWSVILIYLATKLIVSLEKRKPSPDLRRNFSGVLSMHSKTTLQKHAGITIYKWVQICPVVLLFCHRYVHISVKVFQCVYIYMKNSRERDFVSL